MGFVVGRRWIFKNNNPSGKNSPTVKSIIQGAEKKNFDASIDLPDNPTPVGKQNTCLGNNATYDTKDL